MTFTTLYEINSNAQYAPIDFQSDFIQRINANKNTSSISKWFSQPSLLKPKTIDCNGGCGGGRTIDIDKDDYKRFQTSHRDELPLSDKDELYLLNKYDVNKEVKEMIEERNTQHNKIIGNNFKQQYIISYHTEYTRTYYTNELVEEGKIIFSIKTSVILPKGTTTKQIDQHNKNKEDFSYHINTHNLFKENKTNGTHSELLDDKLWCFNIIRKEFKLLEESKRDFYTKYFSTKPFTAFEECGIEVFYARKGYAIDGKRLPNFNRGSVYGLKHSVKENNFKMKDVGGTKKDDLIKFLMKL